MGRMVYRGGPGGGMGGIPGGDVNRAKLALQSNRPDEAARLLRKRLERKPDDHASRLLLAQALLQMQLVDEALVEARRLTRDQPKNADAFLLLAGALTQKQNSKSLEAAEEAARRAVELQPRSGRARVQLAEVLAARRNLKDARLEAEEASRLEPRLPAAHLIRAMVLLADKDYEGAVTASESALRYDDSLFAAHFTLANALIEVRRYDEALVALNRAQTLNPLMLPASNVEGMRGRIYLKQRHFGQAYRSFVQASRSSGRLAWLAPFTGALSMTQILGRYAPQVVLVLLLAAILFGLGWIPVAGPWIVVVLLLGLFGFSFFATVRQYQGSWLPQGAARVPALVTMVAGGAIAFGLVLWLARLITHQAGINPFILFVALVLALIVAAGLDYLWPRLGGLGGRLGRRGGAPSAAS
jgi:tetratricopeptide (TPR) repeat protein